MPRARLSIPCLGPALLGALLGALLRCSRGLGEGGTAPAITAQPASVTVVAPAPATFTVTATGTPAPNFQWNLGGVPIPGATRPAYAVPATTSLQDGESFTVTLDNGEGPPVTSAPAILTVLGPPVILAQPADAVVVQGTPATFTVKAAGNPAPTFQWSVDGTAIPGATAAAYTTPPVTPDLAGRAYTVTLTNAYGSVTSLGATLGQAVPPAITVQPAPLTVVAPAAATFTVTATGDPLTYQWHQDGSPIPGATSATLTLPATRADMNGEVFTVTVGGAGPPVTSVPATLTVDTPPVITSQPSGVVLNAGGDLSLAVAASGNPPPSFQWYRNGAPIAGATAATYLLRDAPASASGSYSAVVANGVGSTVRSLSATVYVGRTQAISGAVTLATGDPVPGILVSVNSDPPLTATTDAGGNYLLPLVPPGSVTVTPSATGSSVFFPSSQEVTLAGSDSTASFTAALGYEVAGTVLYAGANTGTVYVTLTPTAGGSPLATALPVLATGQAFTLQGVPPGTYTLSARMDLGDKGVPNANDPAVAQGTPVTVAAGDVAGLALTLFDNPVDVSILGAPSSPILSPMAGGVVVQYTPLAVNGLEQALAYTVQWSTDPTFLTLGGARTIRASLHNTLFLLDPSLTDGTLFYFQVQGTAGGTFTGFSNPVEVVVGPRTGGNTVTGSVSFSQKPTGPLFVGLLDPSSGQAYVTPILAPISPQAYSLSGVPAGASYVLTSFLDQSRQGVPATGNPANTSLASGGTPLAVEDSQSLDVTLQAADSSAFITTTHQLLSGAAADTYLLNFTVQDGVKHVVAATLLEGPNVMVPASLGSNGGGPELASSLGTGSAVPQPGDTYRLRADYLDGTSQTLTAQVTGVIALPSYLAPSGAGDGSGSPADVTPVFTWDAPSLPPEAFTYQFAIAPAGGATLWTVTGLAPTVTSLAWNADPGQPQNAPSTPALALGQAYLWTLTVVDAYGNQGQVTQTYQP